MPTPNEDTIQRLQEQVTQLQADMRQLKDHQHLGVDGSALFQGSTPMLAESLSLIGNTISRQQFRFSPLSITDGREQSFKQRTAGLGLNVQNKETSSEQMDWVGSVGKAITSVDEVGISNRADWNKLSFAQATMAHQPASTPSLSGPSYVGPLAFFSGERTPNILGTGSVTTGGSTLTDSTASFPTDSLILCLCSLYDSSNNMVATYRILAHTATTLTLGQVASDGSTTLASFSVASGSYTYTVRAPMMLGTAALPWQRLYVGEDIRLGYGTSGGSEVRYIKWGSGSPEGVVPANVGSVYLDFSGSSGATLYTKLSGSGTTGWFTSLYRGAGSPEGVLAAPLGSLYVNTNGGSAVTLYVKETGGSTSTGWSSTA